MKTTLPRTNLALACQLQLVWSLLVLSFAVGLTSLASGEGLDPTFDHDGRTQADFAHHDDFATDVAVAPGSKVVVAGRTVISGGNGAIAVARFNSDGSLDTKFAAGGKYVNDLTSSDDGAGGAVVQSDGKIVVTGYSTSTSDRLRIVLRLNADGTLDSSFATNGVFQTTLYGTPYLDSKIALQSDGKVVIVGSVPYRFTGTAFQIIRLTSAGKPDGTFGQGGYSIVDTTSVFDIASSIAIDGDGKILVGGYWLDANGYEQPDVCRLKPDGNLDPSFNSNGVRFIDFGASAASFGMNLQADGKVVVVGATAKAPFDGLIARLNSDGSFDNTFNGNGRAKTDVKNGYDGFTDVQFRSGKVIATGYSQDDFLVVQYNSDGSLDTAFSGAAYLRTDFATGQDYSTSSALQPDGKLVLAGVVAAPSPAAHDFGVARYDLTNSSTPTPTPTSTPTPQPSARKLLNISTRMKVLAGENVLIGGFIVTGSEQKKLLVRGLGPSLPVAGQLADPMLELHQGNTVLARNDNWRETQEQEIKDTTVPPKNDLESALVRTLAPGSYTAVLAGKNSATGVGQVEVYDLSAAAKSQLANISTRGFVDTGDNVMIGGVIIGGGASGSTAKVLVRAIGPSLSGQGVNGALQDPTLELRDANAQLVAQNDDWKSSQEQAIRDTTVPPTDNRESAIVQTLGAGNYTAIVRGKSNTSGVGLVEVYNIQ